MARLRGLLWLIAGLLIAIIAGFVAYVTLARATVQIGSVQTIEAKSQVVVATRAISVGTLLRKSDLKLEELPVKAIPDGAITRIEDAVDKLTLADIYAGEAVLSQRLTDPNIVSGDGRIAAVVSEDQVLMALPAADLLSNINILKPGDHIDLLFSLDTPYSEIVQTNQGDNTIIVQTLSQQNTKQTTFAALENVTIAAIIDQNLYTSSNEDKNTLTAAGSGAVRSGNIALLVTVSPQDALMLKYLKDAGAIIDFVLRSPTNDRPSIVDPVDMNYIINRYQLPTQ